MTTAKPTLFARHSGTVVWVLFTLLMLLHFATLMRYPGPFPDEPWNGSRALSIIQQGHPFGSLDEGYRIDVKRPWAVFSLLPLYLYSIPILLSGGLSLYGLRLVSLCAGALLLLAQMRIGGRLFGRKGQIATLLATGLSQSFFYASHVARPDVMAAALIYFGFSLLPITRKDGHPLLAGLLAGIALSFHMRALVAVPIFGIFLIAYRGLAIFRSKHLLLLIGGYVVGAAVYPLIHILPDPHSFFEGWKIHAASSRRPPIQDGAIGVVWHSLKELFTGWTGMKASCLFLPTFGILVSAFLGRRRERRLALCIVLSFLSCLFVVRNPILFNLIMISPLFDLATALALIPVFRGLRRKTKIPYSSVAFASCALLCYNVWDGLYLCSQDTWGAYRMRDEAQEFIDSVLLPGESVMGPQVFWLGQQQRKYIAWEGLLGTQHILQSDLETAFLHLKPDILIIDLEVRYFIKDEVNDSTWFEDLRIPKTEFTGIMRKYSKLVSHQLFPYFGDIQIYRFDWSRANEAKPTP